MESRIDSFFDWVADNYPEEKYSQSQIEEILSDTPNLSFRKIRNKMKNSQQTKVIDMSKEEEVVEAEFEEVKESTVDNKVEDSNENSGITYSVRSRGRCDDIIDRASDWASDNPKTAIAVGVGTVALAGYGLYKIVKSAV